MTTRPPDIRKQISSGGVIFRRRGDDIEVALISVRTSRAWCLPKGLIDKPETPAEAALREVREEAGLNGKIIADLGHISYWYVINNDRVKVHKTVHFFLMEYLSGSTDDHDHEVEEARWYLIGDALNTVTYKNEKDILKKAMHMIEEMGQ